MLSTISMSEVSLALHLRFFPLAFVDVANCPFEFPIAFEMVFLEAACVDRTIFEHSYAMIALFLISIPKPFILSKNAITIPSTIKDLESVTVSDEFELLLPFFIHCVYRWYLKHSKKEKEVTKAPDLRFWYMTSP